MTHRIPKFILLLVMLLALPTSALAQSGTPATRSGQVTYRVTIENLTNGQPFSPPVAVTHQQGVHIFQVGQPASDALAAIAQDGNPAPMIKRYQGAAGVTDVVNVGHPLTPAGQTAMVMGKKVTNRATFRITANPGDRFSIATMLICTNDGFLGLDGVELPQSGEFELDGYDAGREENTETSADLVDPCTALGPEALPGDPDGNVDDSVATTPAVAIAGHPGLTGNGELSVQQHGWNDPVAQVTIEVEGGPGATPEASPVARHDVAAH